MHHSGLGSGGVCTRCCPCTQAAAALRPTAGDGFAPPSAVADARYYVFVTLFSAPDGDFTYLPLVPPAGTAIKLFKMAIAHSILSDFRYENISFR